ncbi:PREDICTED: nucleolin 1-like [Camelina sativa]|uniref:Nucleolin 1-like n=1 Tax=Camelina sativa TaxID=90675 RepID=A0ABM1R8X4_CAMSA|nr:PREDICTED: nucleolin 1-like [Camelina sativa]
MGKSSKSSSSEDEGSSSPDVSSIEQDLDSLRVDVASLTATVKSTLDLMPSKEELLAMVTSFQELAKKLAKIPASVAQVTSSSKYHHKKKRGEGEEPAKKEKSDEGEEPAKKKAKSDTNNTRKKESITRPFPVYVDAHPLEKNAQVGEIVEFKMQPGGSIDRGILFVKGYDSSLSENDITEAMLEHFSPCGMIRRIYFQTNGTTPILRHVFLEMLQGTEAALKLNGSDLGGFKLEVHDAKQRDEFYFTRDLDFPFIPPKSRRHERRDPSRFTKESPPVYGIVSSSKINK